MSTYRKADAEAFKMIEELIEKFHPDLHEAGVRVGCEFAYAPTDKNTGEPKGPALKFAGLPATSVIRIVSHKDRVAGMPDAMLYIDGLSWSDEWNEAQQRALIDRKLQEITVTREEGGAIKLDDCHRPKLKRRFVDWLISGFEVIAKRHGENSLEVQEARKLADEYGNLLFDFASA